MWTSGDVQAAIDHELTSLDRTSVGQLDGLIERVRRIGADHGHPLLSEQAVDRIRARLPSALAAPPTPVLSDAPACSGLDRKCEQCGFEWRAREGGVREACFLCRALQAEDKLHSLGVLSEEDTWIGKLSLALRDTDGQPVTHHVILGFERELNEVDCALDIVSRPQVVFRPLLLVVPEECTDGVLVDAKVGPRSHMLTSAVPVPLSLYCPTKWADASLMKKALVMHMDTACVAQDVSLVVAVNRAMTFRAALIGTRVT